MTKDEELKIAIDEQIEWIDGWAKAYPESIFPPVTEEESQALEEFKKHLGMRIAAQMGRHIGKRFEEVIETLNACKEALEQPAQEPEYVYVNPVTKDMYYLTKAEQPAQKPVAWMKKSWCPELDWYDDFKSGAFADETDKEGWTPLYTYPAPSWQGLSDYEIDIIMDGDICQSYYEMLGYARAIEKALKEKNNV